jgi:hypothetical protein
MNSRNGSLGTTSISAALILVLVLGACSSSRSLPKGALGVSGQYNYSPSVIEKGNVRQFWWCGSGVNPNDPSQDTDVIYYEWINTSTLESSSPVIVLAETPGAWDSAYTCNPKVIGGVFQNPLGDGQNYAYAMYYVATALLSGNSNGIGVAFSNDGIRWNKYPEAVIPSTSAAGFGVGQPAVYNSDHNAAIYMFYENSNPTVHHVFAVSNDGLHFQVKGTLTTNGLDADDPQASWGDMAYDSKTGEWYAVFNRPLRPGSTTGGVIERGQYGIELYKIPQESLLTGASPWQQLATTDTNVSGYESNFIAGLVRDPNGTVNIASYPTIQMYTSISYPSLNWNATPSEAGLSGSVENWILMPMEWSPQSSSTVMLNRYFNGSVHNVTSGLIDQAAGFRFEQTLGHLYSIPLNGATAPFYSCVAAQTDYFISLQVSCENQRILGKDGYAYSQPVPGLNLVALYRCRTPQDHFVSKDPKCEGQTTEEVLGYVLP